MSSHLGFLWKKGDLPKPYSGLRIALTLESLDRNALHNTTLMMNPNAQALCDIIFCCEVIRLSICTKHQVQS